MSTIVLDLDDTICEFIGPALAKTTELTGVVFDPRTLTRHWADLVPDHQRQLVRDHLFCPEFYRDLEVWHDGLIQYMIQTMRRKHKVCVVTARVSALGDQAMKVTEDWLLRKRIEVDEVKVCKLGESKLAYFPGDTVAVIDDAVYTAEEAHAEGLKVVMRHQPWNKDYRHQKLRRVHSPYSMQFHSLHG